VIAVVGAAVGVALGLWLGRGFGQMYMEFSRFPYLIYEARLGTALLAVAVTVGVALAGTAHAVTQAVRLPPAEAMRPEPPPTFEPGPLERTGVGRILPSAGRMILRNIERRPMRAALSSLGVAFSVAILVVGMFAFDGAVYMMDLQFRVIQREDLTLTFQESLSATVRYDLDRLDGVTRVETYRSVPVRIRVGHREREVGLQGLDEDSRLRRIVGQDGRVIPVPTRGMVMSRFLADELHAETGDTLLVDVLIGERRSAFIPLVGVVDDLMGVTATMSRAALNDLVGGGRVVSGAYLSVLDDRRSDVQSRLARAPAVATVASPGTMYDTFEETLGESLYISIAFLLGFASVISVGVIYNGSRIALSERGRELASLRVMGFRKGEVSVLLLGEQAIVTLAAIPLGWLIGYGLAALVVASLTSETYRIPLMISPRTYLVAAGLTVAAAVASGWVVRRRVNRLDLIEVLKTRE